MKLSTKILYKFVLMTAHAELICSEEGTFANKTTALDWAKRKAKSLGKKLGIIYITIPNTSIGEFYTPSGNKWLRPSK